MKVMSILLLAGSFAVFSQYGSTAGKPTVIEGHVYFEKTSLPADKFHVYVVEGEEESLTDKTGYFRIESWQKAPFRLTIKNYRQPPLQYNIPDPSLKQVLWIK